MLQLYSYLFIIYDKVLLGDKTILYLLKNLNKRCFILFQLQSMCTELGGFLVEIETSQEDNFLKNYAIHKLHSEYNFIVYMN